METWTIEQIEKEVTDALKVERQNRPLLLDTASPEQSLVWLHHYLNTRSLESIKVLARNTKATDIMALSRSIFESVLTMGLLLDFSSGEGEKKYRMSSRVDLLKMFRNMQIIDKQLADEYVSPADVSELEKVENEYKSRYRSEWPGKDRFSVCGLLDKSYPPVMGERWFFRLMYCFVYKFGSSAAHRTYAGIQRNIGIPPTNSVVRADVRYICGEREEAAVFNYRLGLLSHLLSTRIIGKAFNIDFLEDYFQERVDLLMGGYRLP